MNTVSRSLSAAAGNVNDILTALNTVLFGLARGHASHDQCDKRWLLELFATGSGHFEIV